jgi:hypothetical protein
LRSLVPAAYGSAKEEVEEVTMVLEENHRQRFLFAMLFILLLVQFSSSFNTVAAAVMGIHKKPES